MIIRKIVKYSRVIIMKISNEMKSTTILPLVPLGISLGSKIKDDINYMSTAILLLTINIYDIRTKETTKSVTYMRTASLCC